MRFVQLILVIIGMTLPMKLSAQSTIVYSYDSAGNRTSRTTIEATNVASASSEVTIEASNSAILASIDKELMRSIVPFSFKDYEREDFYENYSERDNRGMTIFLFCNLPQPLPFRIERIDSWNVIDVMPIILEKG